MPSHNAHRAASCARVIRALLVLMLAFAAGWVQAQVCGAPGVAGAVTISAANTVVNTYYPGGGNVSAGATALTVGARRTEGGANLAAGDLILVMQMQDATGLNTSNTASYGGGGAAAGRYEFARVLSVVGATINLTAALSNSYLQNTAVAANQTFQVIRVPQYANLTVNAGASIVPVPWNGTSGGVVVLDVAGTFTNNGSVDASYAGFRGNAGRSLRGAITIGNPYTWVRADTGLGDGGKGEGIAGTPDRTLAVFSAPGVLYTGAGQGANGTATNATTSANVLNTTSLLITTGRSYNGGSRAGGTPGNAGGGGVDDASNNSHNPGGGGGSNWGIGGKGGNNYGSGAATGGLGGGGASSSAAPTWNTPSAPVRLTDPTVNNRLILGGGGGSGTTNDDYELNASGGAGGGLVFIKAQAVAGAGSLLANGQAGRSVPSWVNTITNNAQCDPNNTNYCDGAGGGGAGGGVVVLGPTGGAINVQTRGGDGGNLNGLNHGPGGGGGGGYVFTSTGITVNANLAGGIAGRINLGGTPTTYGAFAGVGGVSSSVSLGTSTLLPQNCLPTLTVGKVTAVPASVASIVPPATTTYSISVSNASGRGDARTITLHDISLPAGMTALSTPAPAVAFSTGGQCALSARTATIDPANAASGALTIGSFRLPGGCSLTYTFAINIPASVADGLYHNSAVASFIDNTSNTTRTVTNATFTGGLTANTSFSLGGAVGGSNYDGTLAANTGEDIRVQRLGLYKAVTITTDTFPTGQANPGDTLTWSVFVRNPSTSSMTVQVSDALPSNLSFSTGTQTISATAGTCGAIAGPPGARNASYNGSTNTNLLSGSAQTLPGGCTVRIDIPTQVLGGATPSRLTNTAVLTGTTTTGISFAAVSSSNLDTPTGVASAVPGISAAGNYPSGQNMTQTGAISVTPTVAPLIGVANLQISKTNGTSTVVSASTTLYTVTVSNLGPSDVNGATLKDPAAAGLSCTAVACTGGTGGAVCPAPASVTLANLQGAGVSLNLPASSSLTFTILCTVTASGL